MEDGQKQTKELDATDQTNTPIPYSELSPQQQLWVDFCAVGGLITGDDGVPEKLTVDQFANRLGQGRSTLYEWKKKIPNFQDLVMQRCSELFNGARTVKVVNALFVSATIKLNPTSIAMWMANQKAVPFRMPQQKVEHDVGGGLADLLELARRREREASNFIEGEVANEPANTDSASNA